MIKCSACEHCGEYSFGLSRICPTCGKLRFSPPEIDKVSVINFSGRVKLQCSNCVYCRRDGGTGTGYFCLINSEHSLCYDWYLKVELTDCCSEFIPNEAIK